MRYLVAAVFALFLTAAHAAVITVNSTADTVANDGVCTLREAIIAADTNTASGAMPGECAAGSAGADTINFSVTGTIVLTTNQLHISDALTIVGPGADSLTIDGNANGRIFSVFVTDPACPALDGPDFLVSISGVRITNGHRFGGNSAGAIFTEHSLALDSVILDHNVAANGGAVAFSIQYPGQSLTISNSRFLNNTVQPVAGPTTVFGAGFVSYERCTGTRTTPVAIIVSNSLFSDNQVQPVTLSGFAGAIHTDAYADLTITDTRIVNNSVIAPNPPVAGQTYRGGGIYAQGKSLTIVRSEIAGNAATDVTAGDFTRAGGLYLLNTVADLQAPADAMTVKVIDSTISSNSSSATAGAMLVVGNVAVELDNTTIGDNVAAPTRTGGIVVSSQSIASTPPTLKMVSSILANSAATTVDLGGNATTIPTFTVDATNSLIETICTPSATCSTISVSGSGNLPATDPMLGPLGFNGGLTRTHPVLAGSPVINAGSNPLSLTVDQRGFARVAGAAADMGAYESIVLPARLLIPDGTSLKQAFGAYPDTKWFALGVEPGKTYVVEAADVDGDLLANAIGTLGVYDIDGAAAPPEANVDCTAANGPRPPAVAVNSEGIRCILRTAPPSNGMVLNKRPVYIKVTRMNPATGGGAQFKIRAREATIYGRWLTNGYDYHVEVENTTGDPMCVEVIGYPASGLTYNPAIGWLGNVGPLTMNVPAFGAVKTVALKGSSVGPDTEGTFRVGACLSPLNLVPGALHVSSFAFDTVASRFIYFFTTTANDGKTRSTW